MIKKPLPTKNEKITSRTQFSWTCMNEWTKIRFEVIVTSYGRNKNFDECVQQISVFKGNWKWERLSSNEMIHRFFSKRLIEVITNECTIISREDRNHKTIRIEGDITATSTKFYAKRIEFKQKAVFKK